MNRQSPVYIRFVCYQQVHAQRQRLGLFQALDHARGCDFSPSWALKELPEIYTWFIKNLTVPTQFSRGGWKGRGQPGLSWFKPVAIEHIRQLHRLRLAVEACGVHVEILTTRDPGEIIWDDQYQIVAEPGARKF